LEVAGVEGLICDGSDEGGVAAAIIGAEGGQDAGVGGEEELPKIRVKPKTRKRMQPKRN
jgi:hypothetical protein